VSGVILQTATATSQHTIGLWDQPKWVYKFASHGKTMQWWSRIISTGIHACSKLGRSFLIHSTV